jgi:hypothetical protein
MTGLLNFLGFSGGVAGMGSCGLGGVLVTMFALKTGLLKLVAPRS